MRDWAIQRFDPTDELRFRDPERNLGCDQRGIKVERTLGDKSGFKRLCDTMLVATEGALVVLGGSAGVMLVEN